MKGSIRYIISLVCIFSLWSVANTASLHDKSVGNDSTHTLIGEACTVDATSIIFPDAGIYLARTGSPINIYVAQQCNRRNDTENRLNTSYLKSGKLINTGVSVCIYNNLKTFRSILSKPIHRLISLGRLII